MERSSELRALLARVRRRWFALVVLRMIGLASAAAAIPPLVAMAFDALLPLDGLALIAAAAIAGCLSVLSVAAMLWRMQRRPDDCRVARFIEERAVTDAGRAPLDDELVSAVEVTRQDAAPAFGALIVDKAIRHLQQMPPPSLIPGAALRRAGMQAVAGAALLAVVLTFAAMPLVAAWDTALLRWYPGAVRIQVTPGDARVPAGTPLRIRASIRDRRGSAPRIAPSLVVSAGGQQRTVAMVPVANGFEFAFESVDRTFHYKVTAGAVVSSPYTVTALFPPRVKRIDVQYRYPAFTGLGVREEEDGGDIYGPAGTRARVRIHTDKPVASGELAMTRGAAARLTRATDTVLETDLLLTKDGSYRVRLADRDGLRSTGDTEYFIRLMDDRPPDVRVLRPASDQQITPLEEVAIEARADDDYGISSFELVYSVAGQKEKVVPFTRVSGTGVARIGAHLLAAEDLRVQPGDVVTYYARARDVPRGKQSTETRSDIFFLEVRPFNEEFVAAQSQAMAGAGDAQIESLIAAQKEIINATWNLERRSGAGRSAEDVKAVAQAQAELKARVEQIASRGGRGGIRPPFQVVRPGQTRPAGAVDPVAAAVEAMTQALRQLEDQRTREALPHEMAALQGLLKAQAEVQRRQVAQQQANGGNGGSGRQGQDLSALFDKELQRQQRTNYETRSQIEDRPDAHKDDSALEKIRELARRQEELSRRERELAQAGLSEDEMKRQLEKLTREQNELREQTEALAKQMAQNESSGRGRPNDQSRQQGNSASSPSGSTARQASEEMRNAAGELQRQDPNAAAARAERAADQLRQLEQQMGAGTADARQRAAGDLQLEAQQIAEAQRRVAAEAERLDKGGSGAGADARRRLAGEKERLAERVDALQRGAERLGAQSRGDKTPAAAGAAEAARELQRQRVAERMRETARQMRAGERGSGAGERGTDAKSGGNGGRGGGASSAQAEQQIARAVEQAAEKLGGSANTEARQLSDQLDRGREIRERLDRLERQMREAEKTSAAGRQSSSPGQGRESRESRQGAGGGRRGESAANQARGSQPGAGGGGAGGDLQRLREEYTRELQNAREELRRLQGSAPRDGSAGVTPEEHEYSRSAPGNEAFKQDYGGWESLRKDVDLALERYETAVSGRLAKKLAEDRLSAGGSDRVPDAYRRLIAKYYEALAKTKK